MSAVLQRDVPLDEPQKRFVNHRRRLQGVAATLRPHVISREAPKLVIDEWRQPRQGLGIAVTPICQQLREVRRHLHRRSLIAAKTTMLRVWGLPPPARQNYRTAT